MKNKKNNAYLNTRLLDEDTPFAVREAFNQLRTNLMYTVTDQNRSPIFAITSADEGEGKSNVIANLAISFTQLGKKVLLIDGDLRCPSQYKLFALDRRATGLSELISGIETDVIMKDIRPGLDLILSGRIPPNPSELITSARFAELLHAWTEEYDMIFVDLPPVGIVTDAVAICKQITGYIFTIRSGKDSSKTLQHALFSMEHVGAKIAGIVLNDFNLRGTSRYHSKSRYNQINSRYENSANEVMQQAKSEEQMR